MTIGRPGKLIALVLAVILAGTAVFTPAYAGNSAAVSNSHVPANPTKLIGGMVLLIVTLGIGLWVSRKIRGNSVNCILAGRSLMLPFSFVALSGTHGLETAGVAPV